jgi:hypothetical protein
MKRLAISILVLGAFLCTSAAWAAPQPPHDFGHGVGCADCHTPYAGLNDPAVSIGTASDGLSTTTSVVDGSKAWAGNQWVGGVVTFTSGANLGQFRVISANTATSLSFALPLTVAPADGDTYKIGKTTEADIETRCKSCHNPAGQASSMTDVGQHQSDNGAIGCGKCHDPHNTVENSGLGQGLIRRVLTLGQREVVYPSGGANPFVTNNPVHPGLCEACHTRTAYYKADGSGALHEPTATSCSTEECHGHGDGFGTAAYAGGHMDPAGAAFTYASAAGANCSRCHTAGGQKWWQEQFLANGQTAVPANPAAFAAGPLTCDTCHNASADALTKVPFSAPGVVVAAPDQPTALCAQCHQGRSSTPTVNSATLGAKFEGTATAGTTTSLTDSTKNFNKNLVGAVIAFTNGSLLGQVRSITAYTSTQVTWATALGSAPTTSTTYQIIGTSAANNSVDTVIATLSFSNVHYLPAAGVLFGGGGTALGGSGTQVGYEYMPVDGETTYRKYAPRNKHVASKDGCTECHSQHSGEVRIETCGACHPGETGAPVATVEELAESRIFGWEEADFDGDGVEEGLKAEVAGQAAVLLQAIQAYATNVSLMGICYDLHTNPYWFRDLDGDGVCGASEAVNDSAHKYQGYFTARLLKAAYNYQVFQKEPGAWAHNPMYIIELLNDSIADLNSKLATLVPSQAVAFAGTRTRFGHFDQDSDVFRHWDYDAINKVPAACGQCHAGSEGMDNYLANPLTTARATPVFGMDCLTCHAEDANGDPILTQVRDIATVRFPPAPPTGVSPTVISMANATDNLCATCHSAREAKGTIDFAIGSTADTSWTLSFKNSHYLGSAGVLAGGDAHVGYEYAGKTYATAWMHGEDPASCTVCHSPVNTRHTFEVAANTEYCVTCHADANFLAYKGASRLGVDYDASGTVDDLPVELTGLMARLYAEIQAYCTANGHTCTYGPSYPYWTITGATTKLNPKALKAAYNYNFLTKAVGAWAHNFSYSAQLVIDSIEDLGGDVSTLVRP